MKWLSFIANKSIKLIIALVFFMLAIGVRANPIAFEPPEFFVSELMFDSSGEWTLKLESFSFDIPETVDSIRVSTSSGSAKLMFGSSEGYQITFILRNDSLDFDLTIRQEGDFVQVTTYYNGSEWGYNYTSTKILIFGDYPGATVRSPKEGESIVHVPYLYTALNDHLLAYNIPIYSKLYAIAAVRESNDRNVCTGKIIIRIHNPNNLPFPEYGFQLKDEHYFTVFDVYRQVNGVLYTADAYACRYSFDKIYPWLEDYQRRSDYWAIDPVQFEMEQDSIIYLDIYLGGDVNTETIKKEEEYVLKIYPNPIVENSFYYETALPVKSTNSVIEITGLTGQKVGRYPVFESKGNIKLPSDIVRGIYTVSLIVNQKNYATTKIIVP